MERWLSRVVRNLNSLEGHPGTRSWPAARCNALAFTREGRHEAAAGRYRPVAVLRVGIVPVVSARCGHATPTLRNVREPRLETMAHPALDTG